MATNDYNPYGGSSNEVIGKMQEQITDMDKQIYETGQYTGPVYNNKTDQLEMQTLSKRRAEAEKAAMWTKVEQMQGFGWADRHYRNPLMMFLAWGYRTLRALFNSEYRKAIVQPYAMNYPTATAKPEAKMPNDPNKAPDQSPDKQQGKDTQTKEKDTQDKGIPTQEGQQQGKDGQQQGKDGQQQGQEGQAGQPLTPEQEAALKREKYQKNFYDNVDKLVIDNGITKEQAIIEIVKQRPIAVQNIKPEDITKALATRLVLDVAEYAKEYPHKDPKNPEQIARNNPDTPEKAFRMLALKNPAIALADTRDKSMQEAYKKIPGIIISNPETLEYFSDKQVTKTTAKLVLQQIATAAEKNNTDPNFAQEDFFKRIGSMTSPAAVQLYQAIASSIKTQDSQDQTQQDQTLNQQAAENQQNNAEQQNAENQQDQDMQDLLNNQDRILEEAERQEQIMREQELQRQQAEAQKSNVQKIENINQFNDAIAQRKAYDNMDDVAAVLDLMEDTVKGTVIITAAVAPELLLQYTKEPQILEYVPESWITKTNVQTVLDAVANEARGKGCQGIEIIKEQHQFIADLRNNAPSQVSQKFEKHASDMLIKIDAVQTIDPQLNKQLEAAMQQVQNSSFFQAYPQASSQSTRQEDVLVQVLQNPQNDPHLYSAIPGKDRTEQVSIAAVKRDPHIYMEVPKEIQKKSEKLAIIAVSGNPSIYKDVPEEIKKSSYELSKVAVTANPNLYDEIPANHSTMELDMISILRDPSKIERLDESQNPDQMIANIAQNAQQLTKDWSPQMIKDSMDRTRDAVDIQNPRVQQLISVLAQAGQDKTMEHSQKTQAQTL